jgi:5'-nucleotidase/UDP-sugar diphosphatase
METILSLFNKSFLLLFVLLQSTLISTDIQAASVTHLTLIGTGDLQGRLEPASRSVLFGPGSEQQDVVGGISRLATLIQQIKGESNHPVIVVSSGDDLMGRYFRNFHGKAIFTLMDKAGYEILALGNHEFDNGPGVLAEALSAVGFTPLCSDLDTEDTVLEGSCKNYLIKEYGGIRVGFFSLMTRNFSMVTLAGKVQLMPERNKIAENMVQLLRQKGAQVIIAITHIGNDQDRKLAKEVDGIDIIFGGHSHGYEPDLVRENNCLVVNGGEKGAALVRLDVAFDGSGHIQPDSAVYSLLPVTQKIVPQKDIVKELQVYRDQLPRSFVVGKTETEWDLTKKSLRNGESGVADLITDTIRKRFAADIVLFNGGAFRGNNRYLAGPVTDTMLGDIDAFESDIFLMSLKGRYLQHILEHSVSQFGGGGFLQVSGIRFTINGVPVSAQSSQKDHVANIQVLAEDGWHPLVLDKQYFVATNDFLAQRGGDNYFWFKKYGKKSYNTYSTMGGVMTEAFLKHGTLSPQKPDGRITFVQRQAD